MLQPNARRPQKRSTALLQTARRRSEEKQATDERTNDPAVHGRRIRWDAPTTLPRTQHEPQRYHRRLRRPSEESGGQRLLPRPEPGGTRGGGEVLHEYANRQGIPAIATVNFNLEAPLEKSQSTLDELRDERSKGMTTRDGHGRRERFEQTSPSPGPRRTNTTTGTETTENHKPVAKGVGARGHGPPWRNFWYGGRKSQRGLL